MTNYNTFVCNGIFISTLKCNIDSVTFLMQTLIQGCIKFLIPHPWGGEFIKSFGEEFQVVKRGREFKGFWEEYHVEKG